MAAAAVVGMAEGDDSDRNAFPLTPLSRASPTGRSLISRFKVSGVNGSARGRKTTNGGLDDAEYFSSTGGPNGLRQYLDREVTARLERLDARLDRVLVAVDHCDRRCLAGLGDLRRACEDLLGRIACDGPSGLLLAPTSLGAGSPFAAPFAPSVYAGAAAGGRPSSGGFGAPRMSTKDEGPRGSSKELPPSGSSNGKLPEKRVALDVADETAPLLAGGFAAWPDEEGDTAAGVAVDANGLPSKESAADADQQEADAFAKITNRTDVRRGKWIEAVTNFLDDAESSRLAAMYDKMMPRFIVMTVMITLAQTTEPPPLHGFLAVVIETIIDTFFALEIFLRIVFSPNLKKTFVSPYNYIDILSAAPLFIRAAIGFELPDDSTSPVRYLLLCCVPVVRTVKVLRRFKQFQLLMKAFLSAFEALPVLLYTLSVIVLVFSSLIYMVEPHDNFTCLPEAVWFSIVTMTTVGYGDITPVSPVGTAVVSFLAVLSVLYMAMPIGIIGYTFTQIWKDKDRILLMSVTRERLDQWGYSARDITQLFRLVDDNDNGELDIEEFKDLVSRLRIGLQDRQVIQLFSFIDKDGGGTIDDEEFVRAIFPSDWHDIYGRMQKRNDVRGHSNSDDGGSFTRGRSQTSLHSGGPDDHASPRY